MTVLLRPASNRTGGFPASGFPRVLPRSGLRPPSQRISRLLSRLGSCYLAYRLVAKTGFAWPDGVRFYSGRAALLRLS